MYEQNTIALDKAKITLMARKNSTFIATILFSLKFSWNDKITTARTNGEYLEINPHFFMQCSESVRVSLLAHEPWHVAFSHMLRAKKFPNKKKYNMAADHVINLMLQKQGFVIPDEWLKSPEFEGKSAEEIYPLIPDSEVPPDYSEDIDYNFDAEGIPQKIKSTVVKAALQAEANGDNIGDIPGEIKRLLDKLINPVLPWNVILQNYLSSYSKEDYSFRKPNKRFLPDFYLPSLYSDSVGHIACAVDASGSVTQTQFNEMISEMTGIKEMLNPLEMTILGFDTRVKNVHVKSIDEDLSDIEFTGGGGTLIKPVFNYFDEHHPEVLIIFTDGYFKPHNKIPEYDVIWVIIDNPKFKCKFGQIIHYTYGG